MEITEAWLAQLEMDMKMVQNPTCINQLHSNHDHNLLEPMVTTFDEELAAALGEDFPYPLYAGSNTSSGWNINNNMTQPFSSTPYHTSIKNNMDNTDNKSSNSALVSLDIQENSQVVKAMERCLEKSDAVAKGEDMPQQDDDQENNEKETKQRAMNGSTKRKREPSQVVDHIMAERNRRQLLTQRFIALSAIVPGLKKMDKTTVLGEAIKYLKQLQEKVKDLEEVAAKRTVESVVLVTKSQLVVDNDGVDDNGSSCTGDESCTSLGDGDGSSKDSVPKIEIMMSDKTLLLKIYCQKYNGILAKVFAEVERHDMDVLNSSVVAFGSLFLNITIVAQIDKGFDKNVKDLATSLRSTILLPSTTCRGPN